MIIFNKLGLKDRDWMNEILKEDDSLAAYNNFAELYTMKDDYNLMVAGVSGFLCVKSELNNTTIYLFPIGKGNCKQVLELLMEEARQMGNKFTLSGVTEEQKEWLEKEYPDKFEYEKVRALSEYIYKTEKLATFAGKKFGEKRRLISKLSRSGELESEPITAENIYQCKKMLTKWRQMNFSEEMAFMEEELIASEEVLNYFDELQFTGRLLRLNGEVIAYAAGHGLANKKAYVVFSEKADASIAGAYPTIAQELALHEGAEYEYLNRMSDMGDEGLRTAKLRYYPDILLDRYNVTTKKSIFARVNRKIKSYMVSKPE